jgi:hypothetical protein
MLATVLTVCVLLVDTCCLVVGWEVQPDILLLLLLVVQHSC